MNSYRTQSLFHYTKRLDNIINILVSGKLIPNYCKEDLSTQANPDYIIGIPQICFCDIPVSLSGNFVDYYGKYAIGFKKEWGIQKGCNPIQYVNNESIIDGIIFYHSIWAKYRKGINKPRNFGEDITQFFEGFSANSSKTHIFGFIKKYMGEWLGKPYCNYEENEWRYIIEEGLNDIWWKWEKGEYEQWRGDKNRNKPAPSDEMISLGLKFKIVDINHIIMYEENEIQIFIEKLDKVISDKHLIIDKGNYSLLLSKITSFERIKNDY